MPVGKSPYSVAVDPGSRTVYVANYDDGTVSVMDASTRTVTATVPVGKTPEGVAVDPGTHTPRRQEALAGGGGSGHSHDLRRQQRRRRHVVGDRVSVVVRIGV